MLRGGSWLGSARACALRAAARAIRATADYSASAVPEFRKGRSPAERSPPGRGGPAGGAPDGPDRPGGAAALLRLDGGRQGACELPRAPPFSSPATANA